MNPAAYDKAFISRVVHAMECYSDLGPRPFPLETGANAIEDLLTDLVHYSRVFNIDLRAQFTRALLRAASERAQLAHSDRPPARKMPEGGPYG